MKRDYKVRAIVIQAAVIIGLLFYITKKDNPSGENYDHKQYVQDTTRLFNRLAESIESRNNLNHTIDSLHLLNQDLLVADSLNNLELDSIPNKFQRLSSKELQAKMNEEYRKRND